MFPIKQVRSLDLLEGSTESPPEIPHKSRRTLMSPQECEISRLAQINSRLSPIPQIGPRTIPSSPSYTTSGLTSFRQLPKFLRHTPSGYGNNNFSTVTRGKLHAPHIVSRRELIPRLLLNSKATFKQALQEEPSLSTRYVRGTLRFLPQVEWIPRFPD